MREKIMARPRSKELTERELEVMHVFWSGKPGRTWAIADIREALEEAGRDLAYTTVATLVRILTEKEFLEQTNSERPFAYRSLRSFDEVSQTLLGDLIEKVFGGSREKLLLRLVDQKKLSKRERTVLESILRENS
jgi:predicted transcriptional regulator